MSIERLASIYLNDHLTAATAGVELARRTAGNHRHDELADETAELADEVEQDRVALRRLMHRLGLKVNRPMAALGVVGERLGRLKPNGFVVRRSPLSDVVELEGLRAFVATKIAAWQVLRAIAAHDNRITRDEVEELIDRAQDQAERLYKLHLRVTEQVLSEQEPVA